MAGGMPKGPSVLTFFLGIWASPWSYSYTDSSRDIMPTRLAFPESRFTLRASIQISVAYVFFRQMSQIPPFKKNYSVKTIPLAALLSPKTLSLKPGILERKPPADPFPDSLSCGACHAGTRDSW